MFTRTCTSPSAQIGGPAVFYGEAILAPPATLLLLLLLLSPSSGEGNREQMECYVTNLHIFVRREIIIRLHKNVLRLGFLGIKGIHTHSLIQNVV
jgi:hypothetical protein